MSAVTFKSVAHLYMGCPLDSGRDITLNARRLDEILNDERDSQPILRRLESMTEEEGIEFYHTKKRVKATPVHQIMVDVWTPETFVWLCKNGFDLFNLIDSNQAIDAATLQK